MAVYFFCFSARPRFRPIRRNVQKGLDSIGEDIRHGIRRLALGLGGDMGVGVQGEPGTVVAQHSAHRFDVHAVLQRHCGERMPLCHNKDKSESPCTATGFGFVFILFPLKKALEKGPRKEVIDTDVSLTTNFLAEEIKVISH